jgi:hypothetical protein
MNQLLWQYSYLQVLDFLTTIAFLVHGVQEANPIVRFAMAVSPGVLPGLLARKRDRASAGYLLLAHG